jgi:acetyl esterase/lipase
MDIRQSAAAIVAVLAFCMGVAGDARAADTADPSHPSHYFRRAFIGEVVISPSGRYLAAAVPTDKGRVQVAVMPLSPLGAPKTVAGIDDSDVRGLHWVNDERLVFSTTDTTRAGGDQRKAPGLYAVNRDGSDFRQLIHRVSNVISTPTSGINFRILTWEWILISTLDDGSPDIVVGQRKWGPDGDLASIAIHRMNTVTGERTLLSGGAPDGAIRWVLDAQGQPKAVTSVLAGRRMVHVRRGDAWERVGDFPLFGNEGFWPAHVDKAGTLYVVANNPSTGFDSIYRFDAQKKSPEAEPLASVKGFDITQDFETDRGQLLGLHLMLEQRATYWFDTKLRAIQASVDKAMPAGRSNKLLCGRCTESRFFVVESSSDKQPGEFYLLDVQDSSIKRIAARRPWIDEATQGSRTFHWFKARDGMQIPVVVTRPAKAPQNKPLPAVVLVHGGPYVRGVQTAWSADAQFLASLGYLVIEPDFRGSAGYGWKHYSAGFRQWGLAMQDDLQDALNWAAQQGWADAKRACIVGGSYGGYAALMGTVRHPDAYKCAVSIAGVTDIVLMYAITWSDVSEGWRQFGMPEAIGDPVKDAEQLKATSPLQQAHRIKTPLLLIHGVSDRRVPIEHERKFRSAVSAAGNAPEYIEYSEEGHGGWLPHNQIEFAERMARFLAKHLN